MLEIHGLGKTYPGSAEPAVRDFNLKIQTGEFVSLIGPTGCGKTTVLRIVTGLLPPSSGEVILDGQLSLKPSHEKAIVFQMFNLFPWRTALGNVAYGLEMHGVPKKERLAQAKEFLRLVGLSDRADHYPHQMSGGQNQRVGLARALAIKPKLMLMDEPFGALDALTREHLQEMVADICAHTALTVLLVTHSVDEAIFLSDRIIVMGVHGRVLRELTVDLPRPRNQVDWRATPQYTKLRSDVWGLLKDELRYDEAVVGA
jgi:NitT/TauT family transport system ATP-binding protein